VKIRNKIVSKSAHSLSTVQMLMKTFDCEGIIHHEFLPHGQMVDKKYYLKVVKKLKEAVRR